MSCRTGKCRFFFLLRRLYLLFGMHQAEVIFSIYCAQDIPAETELLTTSLNILVGSMTFGRLSFRCIRYILGTELPANVA